MVRPDDFGKLFPEGLPEWIEKAAQEKTDKKNPPIFPRELLTGATQQTTPPIDTIAVVGNLGIRDQARMYVFWKEDPRYLPSQEARPFGTVISVDEMTPLGKYPNIRSTFISNKLWNVNGSVAPGTILKVFIGFVSDPVYGVQYFVADNYSELVSIKHPDKRDLYINGKLRRMYDNEYEEYGIRNPSRRAKSLQPLIEEH